MDDSFEVLIYVLFIVVSLLGGLYKNYAKKKEEERQREIKSRQNYNKEEFVKQEAAPTNSFPKSFEDFLNQQMEPFVEEEEQEIMQEQVIEKEPEEGLAAFESTANAILSDDMKDNNFSITDELKNQELINSDILNSGIGETNGTINQENTLEIDLQKAVIYSEILKRPF